MKTSRRFLSVALLLSCIVPTVGVPPASAALKSWTVKVITVDDGDTFKADSDFDGDIDYTVRMVGINTPEGHFVSRGVWDPASSCHSKAARDRLAQLILGKRVVLKASSFSSVGSMNRKLRFVHRLSDGLDLNALMLKESRAVPYPSEIEPSRNAAYIRMARTAAAAATPIRVWDDDACGAGPAADLKIRLRWDANGHDETNLNGEYVRIENRATTPQALNMSGAARGGWLLRDSSSMRYYFRPGTTIPALGSLTVHTGSVPSGRTDGWSTTAADGTVHLHYYWKLTRSVFGNERTASGLPLGDGAYLYDPYVSTTRGHDLRAKMEYPCTSRCTDPIGQKLELTVNYDGPGNDDEFPRGEWVNVHNVSGDQVDVSGYMVESDPWTYEIARGTDLDPGERLRVYGGHGTDSRLAQYWGHSTSMFLDPTTTPGSDSVRIRTMEGRLAKTFRWPCSGCTAPTTVQIVDFTSPYYGGAAGPKTVIKNTSTTTAVDITDWLLYQTDDTRFDFKDATVLLPGETITLPVGANGTKDVILYTHQRVVADKYLR